MGRKQYSEVSFLEIVRKRLAESYQGISNGEIEFIL